MRNWRRKWKRMPAESRQVARASLGDLFEVRRAVRTWLWMMLVISLALHVVTVPFLFTGTGTAQSAKMQGSYLQKVLQKERAKKASKKAQGRITMPPPPDDPKAVIEGTFKESLSADVGKLVGHMLDDTVVKRLAHRVTEGLQAELAKVSENIVEGKMSEEEIKKLHEEFKRKAHDATVDELMKYREETQLERAEMSTTEWYEKEMSPTLLGNINYALLVRRIHYSGLWYHTFCGRYSGWTRYRNWSGLRSNGFLGEKIGLLRNLKTGHVRRHVRKPNAAWPGPSKKQATIIEKRLQAYYNGTVRMSNNAATYPQPSWKSVIYGDTDEHEAQGKVFQTHLSDGVLSEFWPHKEDEMAKIAEALDGRWDKLLDDAATYRERAEAGAGVGELTKLRDACYRDIDALCTDAAKLRCGNARLLQAINHGVRVETLGGDMQDRMFTYWTDEMVAALGRLIRKIAKGQFEKGIIVHKAGVAEAMREFTEKVVPLLRRDIVRMVSRKKFSRLVWTGSPRIYKTAADEATAVPTAADVRKEKTNLVNLLGPHPDLKAYAEKRRELNREYFQEAIENTKDALLTQVLTGGLLLKQMYVFVEGVNYEDRVKAKLDARMAAMQGRGQDLTALTKHGLPDTQAPLVALFLGASKKHGASLEPFKTTMRPGFRYQVLPDDALRGSPPRIPRGPAAVGKKGVFQRQANVDKPKFSTPCPRFEAIPFLHKFPKLDGKLTDWGKIRPLRLRGPRGEIDILLYAAWSYQGFFFGYQVKQPKEEFYYPRRMKIRKNMSQYHRNRAAEWPFRGDHLRLLFDTLDARQGRRGEPHTQEFVVLPQGTDVLPDAPGMERRITSQRDADTKEWRGVKSDCKNFDEQPPEGPDGSGPYRVTQATKNGYTTEVFIPRKLFDVPVLSPGWYIGFDCAVGIGYQGRGRGKRGRVCYWASQDSTQQGDRGGNRPNRWGDLLLLGTDPRFLVQHADAGETYPVARFVIPGHSYLLTVVDPDRNVSLSQKDVVLVSAEVADPGGPDGGARDIEVLILEETKENSGIFRGYVDTQPGAGRQVQGTVEVEPGQEVVFGYVDLANARGERKKRTYIRLPVAAPVANGVAASR